MRAVSLRRASVDTPIGRVVLLARDDRLVLAGFGAPGARELGMLERRFGAYEVRDGRVSAAAELRSYFHGDLAALDTIDVDPGGTVFQRKVWRALRRLPPGRRTTYGSLAASLGLEKGAARAVGAANGANPVSVVIPCHRLTAATGDLAGYAYGLGRKRWLLRHEGVDLAPPGSFGTSPRAPSRSLS